LVTALVGVSNVGILPQVDHLFSPREIVGIGHLERPAAVGYCGVQASPFMELRIELLLWTRNIERMDSRVAATGNWIVTTTRRLHSRFQDDGITRSEEVNPISAPHDSCCFISFIRKEKQSLPLMGKDHPPGRPDSPGRRRNSRCGSRSLCFSSSSIPPVISREAENGEFRAASGEIARNNLLVVTRRELDHQR